MARYSSKRNMAGFIGATGGLPLAADNTAVPTISGTAQVGQTLTATAGTWAGREAPRLTYQWRRGPNPIAGATASTYTCVAGDVGSVIRVAVTGQNWAGSDTATSAATSAVIA